MSWGKFFVITAGLLVFLWLMFCYVYGIFVLNDTIVPYPGTEIDEWLNGYYISGLISGLLGFVRLFGLVLVIVTMEGQV